MTHQKVFLWIVDRLPKRAKGLHLRPKDYAMRLINYLFQSTIVITLSMLCAATPVTAQEAVVRTVILNAQSRFVPELITVPRNVKFLLIVRNESGLVDEIESDDLGTEKAIKVGQSLGLLLGPLRTGTYRFVADLHRETANGQIVVK